MDCDRSLIADIKTMCSDAISFLGDKPERVATGQVASVCFYPVPGSNQ